MLLPRLPASSQAPASTSMSIRSVVKIKNKKINIKKLHTKAMYIFKKEGEKKKKRKKQKKKPQTKKETHTPPQSRTGGTVRCQAGQDGSCSHPLPPGTVLARGRAHLPFFHHQTIVPASAKPLLPCLSQTWALCVSSGSFTGQNPAPPASAGHRCCVLSPAASSPAGQLAQPCDLHLRVGDLRNAPTQLKPHCTPKCLVPPRCTAAGTGPLPQSTLRTDSAHTSALWLLI